jgi:hypothetical protein
MNSHARHGYVDCSCRDCFDIAVCGGESGDTHLCLLCEEAGCEPNGNCQRPLEPTDPADAPGFDPGSYLDNKNRNDG